jgi:hypothetical protein
MYWWMTLILFLLSFGNGFTDSKSAGVGIYVVLLMALFLRFDQAGSEPAWSLLAYFCIQLAVWFIGIEVGARTQYKLAVNHA